MVTITSIAGGAPKAVFDRLGSIQFDPIEIAGRNHDLVLLSRLAGDRREMTDPPLDQDGSLFVAAQKALSLQPAPALPRSRASSAAWA